MAGKRRYEDGCAFAQSLDIVGERWALLVIRELMFGPKRFTDLKADLPGIATNVLTQRLADLEDAGVVVRRETPPPQKARLYALSDWGRDLEPVFKVLGRWAARSPLLTMGWPLSPNAAMLSLGSMFRPDLAAGVEAVLGLHMNWTDYTVRVAGGRIAVDPGRPAVADVRIAGDQNVFLGILYGKMPVAAARLQGLQIDGDVSVLERFAACFEMPEPAPRTPA